MRISLRLSTRVLVLVAAYMLLLFALQAVETRSLEAAYRTRLVELRASGLLAESLHLAPPGRLDGPIGTLVDAARVTSQRRRRELAPSVASAAQELRADPWWRELRSSRALAGAPLDPDMADEVEKLLRADLDRLQGDALAQRLALWLEWVQTAVLPWRMCPEEVWMQEAVRALGEGRVSASEVLGAHEDAFRWVLSADCARHRTLFDWAAIVDERGEPKRATAWQVFTRAVELERAVEDLDELARGDSTSGSTTQRRAVVRAARKLLQGVGGRELAELTEASWK